MGHKIALPPLDAAMPDAQFAMIWVCAALTVCSVIYCGVRSLRTRSWLPVNILVGSGLAMFGESLVIQNMHTWYPAVGQVTAYEAFGQSIPLFTVLAYWFYFAPAILLLMKRYEQGISTAQFWCFWGLTVLGVLAYEVAGLSSDLWIYYGEQPFTLRKLPIAWVFINAATVMPASVILFRLRAHLHGWPLLLVIPFMAAQVPAFEFLTGYPLYVAINSSLPLIVTQFAALAAIGMSLALFWFCSKLVCVPSMNRMTGGSRLII